MDALFALTRTALDADRMRIEASSQRIAMANTAIAGDDTSVSAFAKMVGVPASEAQASMRLVHDPAHPLADKEGMVRYPSVDLAQEMTGLLVSSRSYEANVRAFNMLRAMCLKGLEIGGRR
jgi:flagellar basal-body rod protein FlgC